MKKLNHLDHLILRRLKKSSTSLLPIATRMVEEFNVNYDEVKGWEWLEVFQRHYDFVRRRLQVMRKLHWITFDKSTGLWSITAIGKIHIEDKK